jgi:2-polyprenyl-6-methoxyphenol hydroxylase-like FAD-dependent oxidoreductase
MRTALIVGAGIGGLATGIALRQAGWRARVFERAANPRELGFALNLAPNAMAALAALGLAETLLASGHRTRRVEVRRADGRALKRFEIPAQIAGQPPIVALRQALHGALLGATPADDVALGREAAGFEITPEGVRLVFADGAVEAGDVLIGADGLGSVIRRALHPGEAPPRASGLCAIRGVARGVGKHLGELSAAVYLGGGCEAATARASADAIYWFACTKASELPAGVRDAAAVRTAFTARLPAAFGVIAGASANDEMRVDELCDRDPLATRGATWGEGPVTLVGDAAHPMLPQTGQGAAQALEDAVALGRALAGSDPVAPLLREYERARAARTAAIVRRGRRLAAMLTSRSATIDVLRATVLQLAPARLLVSAFLRG